MKIQLRDFDYNEITVGDSLKVESHTENLKQIMLQIWQLHASIRTLGHCYL